MVNTRQFNIILNNNLFFFGGGVKFTLPLQLSSLRHCLNHTSVHSIMLNDDKCDNTCYYYLLAANHNIHVMVFSSYIKE